MFSAGFKKTIEQRISAYAGKNIIITSQSYVGGGCINYALSLQTNAGIFFLKMNDASRYPRMFETEAKGLKILKSAKAIGVPEVIAFGESEGRAFIILEHIASSPRCKNFWENFGYALATLHCNFHAQFGLDHDNYIGSLPQSNTFHNDWFSFFIEERLQKQVQRAYHANKISVNHVKQFESVFHRLENFFPAEKPSLLHGDLWSGNVMTGDEGEACLIDPAVYYGHREAELAFTTLFGGFDERFYTSYNEALPLQPGFEKRKDVYNLYPLLVHVNLFGGGYLPSVERILRRF
ncbi:MAG TPA: fructosamine kinase family protein [Chitinophagales bacterium]|nr:fructosamine kinase family protein [Chitinophagales bacterium]